jgi:hypothetical protein
LDNLEAEVSAARSGRERPGTAFAGASRYMVEEFYKSISLTQKRRQALMQMY